MVTHARTGVVTLLIGCVLVMSQLVLISPASAATPPGPDWVPVQSSLPSSAFPNDPQYKALLADRMMWNAMQTPSTSPDIVNTGTHAQMQAAAARGAYVPGLSDYARQHGVSPSQVTAAQAGSSYSQYTARPGSGSLVAAQANSRGVFSITTLKDKSMLSKAGKAMGGAALAAGTTGVAVVGTFEIGYAVGGVASQLLGLPTGSGSSICDLAQVFTDSTCALAPTEDYVVNADVALIQPGWRDGKNVEHTPFGDVQYIVEEAPAYGQSGRVTLTAQALFDIPKSCVVPGGPFSSGYGWATGSHVFIFTAGGGYGSSSGITASCDVRWGPEPKQTGVWDVTKVGAIGFSLYGGPGSSFPTPTDEASGSLRWYPPGHPQRPETPEENPARNWQTNWTCTDGIGGSASSDVFYETDESWPAPPDPNCAAGVPKSIVIIQRTEGLADAVVYEWSLPEEHEEFLGAYPECTTGGCVLDLLTTKTGVETSCFSSPELCTDWIKDPNRETDFQCRYAGSNVPLSECFLYGPTFNRVLVSEGKAYGDPETGEPMTPSTSTPGTGGGSEPPQDPNCPPPFSVTSVLKPWWYYKGLECGLRWAFVPSGVGGVTSGIFGAYEASAASGLVGSTKELLSIPMNGQCGVLFSVQPSVFGGQTFSVDTCSEFWTGAAPIRSLLGVSMVLLATIAGVRIALTSLGVTMFDGKGAP